MSTSSVTLRRQTPPLLLEGPKTAQLSAVSAQTQVDGETPQAVRPAGDQTVQAGGLKPGAYTAGAWFGRLAKGAATVVLGAVMLTGCASMQGGMRGAPLPAEAAVVQSVDVTPNAAPVVDQDTVRLQKVPKADSWRVQSQIASMERTILDDATPPLSIFFEPGRANQTVQGNYKKNTVPAWEVTNLGPSGKIGLMLLMPVSGHVGDTHAERVANAQLYAEVDLHKVWLVHPDQAETVLFENLKADGRLVTPQAMVLELKPGKNVLCWDPMPGKTGGIYGFLPGRTIEVYWDGK